MKTFVPFLLILLCVFTYYASRNTELDFDSDISECEDDLRMPNQVVLNKSVVYLHVGDTAYLEATVLPFHSSQNLSWDSMNPDVVSVHGGTIVGKAVGDTYIVASTLLGGIATNCTVHVVDEKKNTRK